jgi:CHAT domain-containing protein/Flp pilus assembly protein TadD
MSFKLKKLKQGRPNKEWMSGLFLYLLFIVNLTACSTPLQKEHISTEVDEKPLEKLLQGGTEAYRRSDYSGALNSWNEGYKLAKESGKREYESVFATKIGAAYYRLGQGKQALPYYQQALEFFSEVGDQAGEGKVLGDMGLVYAVHGQYSKALCYLEKSLSIAQEIHDWIGYGDVLGNIGLVYSNLGQHRKALSYHKQMLKFAQASDDEAAKGKALGNIGIVYYLLGQYETSLEYLEHSKEIQLWLGDRAGAARVLGNIGLVYSKLGSDPYRLSYLPSLLYHEEALEIFHEIGDWAGEARTLGNIGNVYADLEKYSKALSYYEQALGVANKGGAPETLWRVFFGLQQSHQSLDNPLAAIFFGKQSVNTLQSIRTQIGGLERSLQQSFIRKKRFVYEQLADLLIDEGRLAEAQQILAMLKEEEYFDYIRRRSENDPRGTRISFNKKEKPLKTRYNRISKQLVRIAREHVELVGKQKLGLTAQEQKRLEELEMDLNFALKAHNDYLVELKVAFKETERKQEREFPEEELKYLRAFQGTLKQLGERTVVIHFLSTSEKLRIIVTSGTVSLPPFHRDSQIGEKQLNRLIFNYRDTLQRPLQDPLPQAQQLYDFILKPIDADLREMKTKILLVYLDGTLRYLPLSTLHDGKRYVAERYGVVMYTPAAKDKLKDRPGGSWQAAGLGVSEATVGFSALEAVPEELDGIVKESADDPVGVLPGTIHLNKEFTAQNLSAVLHEGYPLVHVASHFRFVPGTEVDSFLLLGAGERLSLERFVSVKYPLGKVDLLTLSACETALGSGEKEDGSEVEGFGVLAQRQGAKAVLATLWKVADRSTGQFMQLLYKLREEKKLTKAEALRRVQQMFIRGEMQMPLTGPKEGRRAAWPANDIEGGHKFNPEAPYTHPYYWAPFILMGNFL